MKHKPDFHTRIAFAMQLYDTAEPQLSIRKCEKMAGLKHPALLTALRRRELKHEMTCPTCGLVPGQKLSLVKAKKLRDQQRKANPS